MGVKKFIKNRDMFGHPVVLNFNRQGNTYFTSIGGILSIIMNIVLLEYCLIKLGRMIERSGDAVVAVTELTDFEDLGEVSFKDAEFMPILVLKSSFT